jgi:predicted chitinase
VQLTWKANYEKMGQALKLKDPLVIHPEKALSPETALRDYVVWHAQRLFHWS